jgi:hypothetical protein
MKYAQDTMHYTIRIPIGVSLHPEHTPTIVEVQQCGTSIDVTSPFGNVRTSLGERMGMDHCLSSSANHT